MEFRPKNKTEIARRFNKLRRPAFMTQLELGQLIGVCRQAVSDIENKKTLPHSSTWKRFAVLEAKHKEAGLTFQGPCR